MSTTGNSTYRYRRIAVIGTTCSGKTTLARHLAERLGYCHVELDALHWDAGWAEVPLGVFRQRTNNALAGETWVADGNYGKVRDIVWSSAEMLVWLDYSLLVIYWRLTWRTLRRIVTQEQLWNGNRERLRDQFGRDSLFLYVLQTHRKRRRAYSLLFAKPEYAHLSVVHLRSPHATERWRSEFIAAATAMGSEPRCTG